jgi:hypothetical protein
LQAFQSLLVYLSGYYDKVTLRNTVFRVSESLSQFTVVGQQYQPCAGGIQSTDRKESCVTGHKFDDAWSALWVCIGAEKTSGFMDREINRFVPFEWFAIDENFCFIGVDFCANLGDHSPVDLNTPLGDQLVDMSSRTKA